MSQEQPGGKEPAQPHPERRDPSSPIGTAYFFKTTLVGIERLFPGGKVIMGGVERPATPELLSKLREQREAELTKETREDRQQEARARLRNSEPYDLSAPPEFQQLVDLTRDVSRDYLAERLTSHQIPPEEISDRTANLQPYYLPRNKEAVERNRGGEIEASGLIVVYPESFSEQNRPFGTMNATAHEMSHAAMGERAIIGIQEDTHTIIGLARQNVSKRRLEGAFLENAFAELDASRIYARMKTMPTKPEILQSIIQTQQHVVEHITPETTQIMRGDPAYEAQRHASLPIYERILAAKNLAKNLGISPDWIEAMEGSEGLDQIVILLKLARMLGYQEAIDKGTTGMTSQQLVDTGLFVLEASRVHGTDDAQQKVRQLLGKDADLLLLESEHPAQEKREALLRMLRTKEEHMNPEWIRKREAGESELY